MSDYSIRNRTVIAATANESHVTLFFADGETMVLPSNQEFTKQVVDVVTPALAKGQTITLNMEYKSLDIFSKYQEKTGGLVKFFRVMKHAITGKEITPELLHSIALPLHETDLEEKEETVVAVVDYPNEANEVSQEDLEAAGAKYDELVDLRDKPVDQGAASAPAAPAPNTPSIVVGAEKLATQVKHFTEVDDEGFRQFLSRMANVAKVRKHSAQELLDFLKKNDLPIAADGCIVAYKRLTRIDRDRGIFVDTHTKKVTQRVGTKVFMQAEMVDPNRRNECSNGLHVGRRDYMSNFSGDAIVLVKIRPEDVIAVPQDYSGAKMRCCAYTIVGEVTGSALKLLSGSQDMTKITEAAKLLTHVLKGDHPPAYTTVEITQNSGGGLVFRDTRRPDWAPTSLAEIVDWERSLSKGIDPKAEPVAETKALEQVTTIQETIDPKENSPEVIKKKAKEATKNAPVKDVGPQMTEQQKLAKSKWAEIKAGTLSKSQLARDCGTSTRSLDRWAEKFGF